MATADGQYIPMSFYSDGYSLVRGGREVPTSPFKSGKKYVGAKGDWKFYAVPLGAQYHYRMRAWNTVTAGWEIWTSVGTPDVNPPSGDPVTNVTLIGITEEV